MTKILPLQDRLVVKRLEEEDMTKGGIVIPDSAKEKPQQGKVLAVGPGKFDTNGKRIEPEVKVDDTVLFAKYAGTEIELDEKLVILREEEILGVIQ